MVTARFEAAIEPKRAAVRRAILVLCGVLLLAAAALVSNESIERGLVSDPARSLSWGTTLFRILLAGHGLALLVIAKLPINRPNPQSYSTARQRGVNGCGLWCSA